MAIRVLAVGNSNTTQADHRALITALTAPAGSISQRPGLFPSNSAADITNVSAMQVKVGPFKAVVQNSSGSEYLVQSDSDITLTFDPGEAGVARTDRIIVRVYNSSQDGSGRNEAVVEYLKGQTSGSASALPTGSLLLFEIPVPAGASSGTGGINFVSLAQDRRVYTTASGGILPVVTTAEMNAISNPYDGMVCYVRSLGHLYVNNGSLWRPKGALSVASFSGLSGIVNPEDGTLAVARDTDKVYVYNGSSWVDKEAAKARVHAYKNNSTGIANNSLLPMDLGSEVYKNTASMHSNTTNNTRITVPKTSCYHVSGQVQFFSNATGRRVVTLRKNAGGNPTAGTQVAVVGLPANNTDQTSVQVNIDLELAANDHLEIYALQSSGVTLNVQGGAEMTFLQVREVD